MTSIFKYVGLISFHDKRSAAISSTTRSMPHFYHCPVLTLSGAIRQMVLLWMCATYFVTKARPQITTWMSAFISPTTCLLSNKEGASSHAWISPPSGCVKGIEVCEDIRKVSRKFIPT